MESQRHGIAINNDSDVAQDPLAQEIAEDNWLEYLDRRKREVGKMTCRRSCYVDPWGALHVRHR